MCARVPLATAQFVLKMEKLSHIMGTAPIVELARLRSPSPIMAPDGYDFSFDHMTGKNREDRALPVALTFNKALDTLNCALSIL